MTRQIGPQGKALIQSFESCRLTSYQDDGGVWTIGWGHTGPEVKESQTITQQQADDLFDHDIAIACQDVEDLVKVELTDNEFAALVSFDYNLGRGNLSSSTLLRLLNGGDFASVPSQLLQWDKIKVNGVFVDSPGLLRRRKAEGALWLTPDDNAIQAQTVVPVQSITPVAPPQVPIYRTKTILGGVTAFVGSLLDKLTGVDFTGAANQISAFSDLGHYVRYFAFALTAAGFGLVIYGRAKVRSDTGA